MVTIPTRLYVVDFISNSGVRILANAGNVADAGTTYPTYEQAVARVAQVNATNPKYDARILILDVVGTPLEHGGKLVGIVPL